MMFLKRCLFFIGLSLLLPVAAQAERLAAKASPDQVLVLYNADWDKDGEGSAPGQDSREVAEYYVQMHTDPLTGKKPYLLGLSCVHRKKHLNPWKIEEVSGDNKNGLVFRGQGKAPEDMDWPRNSRLVEITIPEEQTDWDSLVIRVRSEVSGEEQIVFRTGDSTGAARVLISGPPRLERWQRQYPMTGMDQGRCFRFDATEIFRGTVTVLVQVRKTDGKMLRDLKLRYFDLADFEFSTTGADGVSDEKILQEDVLLPLKAFLEDPARALPDGTLLKDHILYIVLVHGLPYAGSGVYGIEHGLTSKKGDHGVLASLEQRVQTLYYDWQHARVPIISMFIEGGPDAKEGVGNHIITSGFRRPLSGRGWNPYMHPDTYGYLAPSAPPPTFHQVAPLALRRRNLPAFAFAYAVSRIDGASAEDAKRLIDNAVYASRYLRPEMDCQVRRSLREQGMDELADLDERLRRAEGDNRWGRDELRILGFSIPADMDVDGLPFLVRNQGDSADCLDAPKWDEAGFFPGGMGRRVISGNGWDSPKAEIWQYVAAGVSLSACGSPAFGGGPHITNATFWDNYILLRYLLRGMDLGEALLLSSYYVNWSTSLLGDPLMRADLRETVVDRTAPGMVPGSLDVALRHDGERWQARFRAFIPHDPREPEVARLLVSCEDAAGTRLTGASPVFSRRPQAELAGLAAGQRYTCRVELSDPYGNRSTPLSLSVETGRIGAGNKFWRGAKELIKDIRLVE